VLVENYFKMLHVNPFSYLFFSTNKTNNNKTLLLNKVNSQMKRDSTSRAAILS